MFKPLFDGHREACFFCAQRWGNCTCNFPDSDNVNAAGFEFEEFWITAPNVSVCSRFFIDPVVYFGEAYLMPWKGTR